MRRYLPRSLRPSTPAKVLLVLILLVLWLQFPANSHRPGVTLIGPESQQRLESATQATLLAMYEEIRLAELERKGFNATDSAKRIRAELTFPDNGKDTFDPSTTEYIARLRRFVDGWCTHSPHLRNLHDALNRANHKSVGRGDMPRRVWSTSRDGSVDEHFHLWSILLPKPLSESLKRRIGDAENGDWEVTVVDDDGMDNMVSEWTGEKVSRGIQGRAQWEALWGKMGFGVLRSDLFRYMALLFEGGIYADSDTAPITHPYVWGSRSDSLAHPDLEIIQKYLSNLAIAAPPKDRLNPREDIGYVPPYIPHPTTNTPTIVSPEINLVVAIEWDSSFAWNWRRWPQWTAFRLRRSRRDCCGGRSLQIAQYAMMAKPFHPILIDAVQTIVGLVYHGGLDRLGALDVTGPGPFSDAVFRYLLVQYGITPEDLRDLRGPTRVGDVLILQEEALLAPESAMRQMMRHVYDVLPNSGGDPWYWGSGYESWRSGGPQVVYHGLTGSWKGLGWNE